MDHDIAALLVQELERQFRTIRVDKEKFLDALLLTEVPESERFAERVRSNEQTVEESDRFGTLSLRRVLRNANAEESLVSGWRSAVDYVTAVFGFYSSDVFKRRLLESGNIVTLMQESKVPYSLLGKFKLVDYETHDGNTIVATHPVLIIPGVKDRGPVDRWERMNTKYEKEVSLGFFRYRQTLNSGEY